MENKKIDFERTTKKLIDFLIDSLGIEIYEVVELLIESGLGYDDIANLGFNRKLFIEAQLRLNKGLYKGK
jgi:hypothetical protein